MWVHLATTSAMSSASTSSLRKRCFFCSSASLAFCCASSFSRLGRMPNLSSAALVQVALALGGGLVVARPARASP